MLRAQGIWTSVKSTWLQCWGSIHWTASTWSVHLRLEQPQKAGISRHCYSAPTEIHFPPCQLKHTQCLQWDTPQDLAPAWQLATKAIPQLKTSLIANATNPVSWNKEQPKSVWTIWYSKFSSVSKIWFPPGQAKGAELHSGVRLQC